MYICIHIYIYTYIHKFSFASISGGYSFILLSKCVFGGSSYGDAKPYLLSQNVAATTLGPISSLGASAKNGA